MYYFDNDEKGMGSIAHFWPRLKEPGQLSTYLDIIEAIGIPFTAHCADTDAWQGRPRNATDRQTFVHPPDHPANITLARSMIAEHVARNNLDLARYISADALEPIRYTTRTPTSYSICDNYWEKRRAEAAAGVDPMDHWLDFYESSERSPLKSILRKRGRSCSPPSPMSA
jgi:hypothetical protein